VRDIVIHGPTGLELDFGEDDFGGARQAAVVAAWSRRHRADPGEFICWVHRDHEKPWLYLQQRGAVVVAAHWPGSKLHGSHEITHGVSDEHKRQVEYIARAGGVAGFTVKTEVRLPTRVRSDAVIYGPTTTGVEVQRSQLTPKAAKSRTTKARRAGVLPIWFSDAARNPGWMFQVPSVRMNEQPWNAVPRTRSVTVVSGVRVIRAGRCRDIPDSPCPNRRRGCNRWHPISEPRLGVTVDDLAALVPNGELVPISYKTLGGDTYTLIVSRADKATYEEVTGDSGDLPLRPKERLVRTGSRTECSADAGAARRPIALARTCAAGVTPCGEPARFYPCGWRCDAHRIGSQSGVAP
jgi:hypothetical protein